MLLFLTVVWKPLHFLPLFLYRVQILNATITCELKTPVMYSNRLSFVWSFFASRLLHSISVSPECDSLSRHCHQYHQTWAVLLEALSCQSENRCLHAIHCHSYHSYSHSWVLHMSWSSHKRTYHFQMLLPSTSFLYSHVIPTKQIHRLGISSNRNTRT